MDFVHGMGNGKNRHGQHARPASMLPMEKAAGLRPAPAGAHLLFLLGRNGHDGSANASPDCFYLVAMGTTARLMPRLIVFTWSQWARRLG